MSAADIFSTPYFCADYSAETFRIMTVVKFPVVLVAFLLNLLWTFGRGDVSVSCDFKQNCILPCSFEAGSDAVIHWIQTSTGDTRVYSFYHNKDQLSLQADRFKGRTSLFTDQISRGNASLHLSRVEFQDTGTYKCYTSTISGNKESFINMIVDAPVQKVDIKKVEHKIICSSEGIYPEPTLTWSTSSPDLNLDPKTDIQPEGQLYNINSFLTLSEDEIELDYSCTISTRKNRRTATLFKPTFISDSESETTIPCSDSKAPVKSLVWKFNHNQLIVNKSEAGRPYTVSEEWRQYVKSVSEIGALTLQNLSSDQKGMYMCELDNANQTFKRTAILQSQGDNNVAIAVGTVVGLLLVAALITGLVFWRYRNNKPKHNTGEAGEHNTGEAGEHNTGEAAGEAAQPLKNEKKELSSNED